MSRLRRQRFRRVRYTRGPATRPPVNRPRNRPDRRVLKENFVSDSSESGSNKCSGRTGSDGPGNSRLGSAGKGSSDGKPTRVRTVLNEKQLHTLRTCYSANPRPDALMKEQLVEMTGLSPRVIRVWFQNKRCKDKKRAIALKQQIQQDKVRARHRLRSYVNAELAYIPRKSDVYSSGHAPRRTQ